MLLIFFLRLAASLKFNRKYQNFSLNSIFCSKRNLPSSTLYRYSRPVMWVQNFFLDPDSELIVRDPARMKEELN